MKEYKCLYCEKIIKNDPRKNAKVCIRCTAKIIGSLTRPNNMDSKLTEEEKIFIADLYQNKDKSGLQIMKAFKEKFGWIPSASEINKYQNYKINEPHKGV